MIKSLHINGFKSFSDETLKLKPLTILTGLNSTGKSSCFQAILMAMFYKRSQNTVGLIGGSELLDFQFEANRNRYTNAKKIGVSIVLDSGETLVLHSVQGLATASYPPEIQFDLEDNVYYLSANRLGYSLDFETISPLYKVGLQGEYVFGTFEEEKSRSLEPGVVRDRESSTLSSQLNWWLEYILGIKMEMDSEKISSSKVKFFFKSDGLTNIEPRYLGVGVSYLAKILITCLRANRDDVLMIENPEIHLHPAAQARLMEFFVMIAGAGRQVLIETHSENMLNKARYAVYKHQIDASKVVLFYKDSITSPFIQLEYKEDGTYSQDFPVGFFDATLEEMMEMN